MATKKNVNKKTTAKKTTANKSGAARTKAPVSEPKQSRFMREILHWITIAVCLILFLSLFGICGIVGSFIASVLFGCFGLMAYVFPFLLYFLIRTGLEHRVMGQKLRVDLSLTVLFLCLTALAEMLFSGDNPVKFSYAYRAASADHFCGGVVGLALVRWISYLLGETGALIVYIVAMIISGVLLTQKSLMHPLQDKSRSMVARARQQARQASSRRTATEYTGINFAATDLKHPGMEVRPQTEENVREECKEEIIEEQFPKEKVPRRTKKAQPLAETVIEEEVPKESTFHIVRAEEESRPVSGEELMAQEQEKNTPEQKPKKMTPKEKLQQEQQILSEIRKSESQEKEYAYPPLKLLTKGGKKSSGASDKMLYETAKKLEDTLNSFGVKVTVTNASCGPTVTRYELQTEQGVKVSRIVNLADDIKLNLAVADIRIEAPIPGKAAVGIEVPNPTNSAVYLGDLLDSAQFKNSESRLSFAVGKDIAGQPVIADIAKMPHLLIAGATGSGKSVCINTLIMSILYKAKPDEVKLIMIDPKVVELSVYNGIPHLLIPVVTDPKKAAGALNWAVTEMTDRYNKFAQYGVRDMKGYNKKIEALEDIEDEKKPAKMPQIVVIVDELADLMMVASSEVEDAICRLAQLARAAGIHLIIATQRPSVNVITGLIKANMPSRVAFAVSSGVDSRTILDMNGAEKLLGKGDMLFYPQGYPKPARLQGSFVSDKEVGAVVDFLKNGQDPVQYDESITEKISAASSGTEINSNKSERDMLFAEAGRFIIEKDKASIGMLQRMFKIGFNRAARIMDQLCEAGVVSGEEGTKPRKILLSMEEFEQLLEQLE